jgi:FkbM family methyltransferase
MKETIKNAIKTTLEKFNIGITTSKNLRLLKEIEADYNDFFKLKKQDIIKLLASNDNSKSQLKQDLFVLHELNFKHNGFFVEFGATNGIDFSNTFLLEKDYAWDGILAEPARNWHKDLKANRTCNIETNCVWINSNTVLEFNEAVSKELSTIKQFNASDGHEKNRMHGELYNVNSISLIDLLDKYNAPKTIDYLSIDTEGSEYEILSHFDFSKYSFKIISCEHNFTENRDKIYQLLTRNGYKRKFNGLSKWDDWYVKI